MKKWSLLPALCLLVLLAACSASGAEVDLAAEDMGIEGRAFTGEIEAPSAAPEETIRYTVDIVNWDKSATGEDGEVLVTSSLQIPELTPWREDGTAILEPRTTQEEHAAAVAAAFNEKFKDWFVSREFQEYADVAQEHLNSVKASGQDWWNPYSLTMVSAVYQTERLVSVSANYSTFTGGAHPNNICLGWNFDLENGAFFDAGFLAEDGPAFLTAVKDELCRQANLPQENGYYPAMDYWEGYENTLANWSSYAVSFDSEGMTVIFSQYELASYANGPQVFKLSYDWLRPRLSAQGLAMLGLE